MRSYQMSKAIAAMDNVSPVKNSPSEFIDLNAAIARETITIKVRSRKGLLRFEDYPMVRFFFKESYKSYALSMTVMVFLLTIYMLFLCCGV